MARTEAVVTAALSPREWRFIRVGALVSGLAIAGVFGALPFARHWRARELQLSAEQDHLAHLRALVTHRVQIDSAAAAREVLLNALPRRVVRARSRALAASALQSLLQDLADASNVTITRLDVASTSTMGEPRTTLDAAGTANMQNGNTEETIPVTVSAVGDIYGLTTLLDRLRSGPRVVVVDRITVQVNSALRGAPDVLQIVMSLHAPVVVE